MVYEDPTFFVKSGDESFVYRQKNIFDKLTVAEKERNERQQEADHNGQNNNSLPTRNYTHSLRRVRSEMKQFKRKESIFTRPVAPPPRFKSRDVPDYHRNPHKWIKYSLEDVSQEDMSDQSNTAAALSFLKEIRERKRQQEMVVEDKAPGHITFKQPKNKTKLFSQHDAITRPAFRSSKLIMPEYVVGMSKKKDKKKHDKHDHLPPNENIMSEIKLQHLTEEEDDDDDDDDDDDGGGGE